MIISDDDKKSLFGQYVNLDMKDGRIYSGRVAKIEDDQIRLAHYNILYGHDEYDVYFWDDIADIKILSKTTNESNNDLVNHPDHYQSEAGLEVIDVIEAFTSDLKGAEAVCTGNALKYLCRWKKKNGLQDLQKAKWYLERLINHLEKESN